MGWIFFSPGIRLVPAKTAKASTTACQLREASAILQMDSTRSTANSTISTPAALISATEAGRRP